MVDEDGKDRLGDTLQKKKRADEEQFFAEQDRQRLTRMREQRQTAERAHARECPRCGKTLTQRKVRAVTVDECGEGHGIWLDAGELEHLGGSTVEERTSILRVVLGDLGLVGKR